MKTRHLKPGLSALPAALLILSGCGNLNTAPPGQKPRVELPQQFRLPQNDIATTFEIRNGRIAVTGEDGNILIMDQTGGNVVQLTRDGNQQSSEPGEMLTYNLPIWSPDARQIALVELTALRTPMSATVELNPAAVIVQRDASSYVLEQTEEGQSIRPAEPGVRVERRPQSVIIQRGSNSGDFVSSAVYLAQADGKRPLKELFMSKSSDVPYLDWSPDSSKIAFLTQNSQDQSVELNVIDAADGARPRKVLEGASAFWNWNPDGKTLAATLATDEGGPDKLSIVDIAADKTTKIPTKGALPYLTPHFSPDGNSMLITEDIGDNAGESRKHKLVLADRNGKTQKTLTEFTGRIGFAWSPAGDKVAYIVQADPQTPGGPLTVQNVNSGEKRVIDQHPVVAFFWAPDGQRIASFSRASAADIPPNFAGFDFSPPMMTTLFLLQTIDVNNGNARGLFYFAPTTAFLRLVSEFDRFSRAVNIWSPDGRKLVFTLMYGNSNGSRDYVLETEASGSINPRVIGNGGLAFWSPK
jgi:Tol biopolymer transport system component